MTGQVHGGRLDAAIQAYGGRREEWLDLSTGISPLAYPIGRIEPFHFHRLPDRDAIERLTGAARNRYQVPDGVSLVCSNGTQAIINQLPHLFSPSRIAVLSPTYTEHAYCWEQAGHRVSQVSRLEDIGECKVVVVVNPNNPDGRTTDPTDLAQLADRLDRHSGTLVVDEAFCDCVPDLSLVPTLPRNGIVLRSFGKFFGLAGVRLGFAICQPSVADRLVGLFGPWNVSGPALKIGAQALDDEPWIQDALVRQTALQKALCQVLVAQGLEIVGGTPLFALARHDDAASLAEQLRSRKILVREFQNLPDHLRFGLCADEGALSRLKQAMVEIDP